MKFPTYRPATLEARAAKAFLVVTLLAACWPAETGRCEGGVIAQSQSPWTFDTINLGAASADGGNVVLKGLAVSVGGPGQATVCYDLDLCRLAGAWLGGLSASEKLAPNAGHRRATDAAVLSNKAVAGFEWNAAAEIAHANGGVANGEADILKTEIASLKNRLRSEPSPALERLVAAHEKLLDAWTKEGAVQAGEWTDPRVEPYGPLPNVSFRGMYVDSGKVLLKWTVNGTEILEAPDFFGNEAGNQFVRFLRISPTEGEILILLAEGTLDDGLEKNSPPGSDAKQTLQVQSASIGGKKSFIAAAGDIGGVTLTQRGRSIYARVPASHGERKQSFAAGGSINTALEHRLAAFPDFAKWSKGEGTGPAESVVTKGEISASHEPYVVDTISVPDANPWQVPMLLGGFDFFKDGRAAVCTFSGDLFIVSGIDATMESVTWRRFATGLFQPLGLKIVNGDIYVACRDGITRFKDASGSGSAYWYERFNNDLEVTANAHEYVCDLQTDSDGNFYFTKGSPLKAGGGYDPVASQHGAFIRVSADGRYLQALATGFRAPNGNGVGPEGQMTCGETTGPDVPFSKLNWIAQGAFYGAKLPGHSNAGRDTSEDALCWIPKEVDNSPGGQVWASDARWGPWVGRMLHTSYGQGALFGVLAEEVVDPSKPACCVTGMQAGIVRFPLKFASGIMRGRFNPIDGQLYVCGLRGWGTAAAGESCFQRVRYTGAPVRMPIELHAKKAGMELRFSCTLDTAKASDPDNWTVETWNYPANDAWEPPFSFADIVKPKPSKNPALPQATLPAHERLKVKRVSIGTDDRTVFLEIPGLRPVMQMSIAYRIKSSDGVDLDASIYNTVNALGD